MATERARNTDPLSGRVLVFDGDEAARDGLVRLLAEDGFDVHACGSAEETLEAVDGADALIVGHKMPQRRLEGLLRRVEGRHPNLPVFLVTAYGDTALQLERIRVVPAACFPKPVPYESLLAAIRRALRREPLPGAAR